MLILLPIFLGFYLAWEPNIPANTAAELAEATKCDIGNMTAWAHRNIEYEKGYGWGSAERVLASGKANCVGYSNLYRETLRKCGYYTRVQILSNGKPVNHAVTLFQAPDGRRGFVNQDDYKIYDKATAWDEVIAGVSGGPWKAE